MLLKTATGLAFATACLTAVATMPAHAEMPARAEMAVPYGSNGVEVVTNGPQTNLGDNSSSWSAQRNVTQSQQYDQLVESNRAFRQTRMRTECGPITDPQLHQDCLASFGQDEQGSPTSHRSAHRETGR
jgi:hypothetical protein